MSMTPWFGGPGGMDLRSFAGGNTDDATAVDWRETDKEHIFTAEIPGVRKEDVKVEDGAVLKIEKAREREGGESWKRRYGSFLRRFRPP